MKNTTLCYITRGEEVLMLHRVKKENDLNHDKWIGVGGKFLSGETPEQCLLREVQEETGLRLTKYRACGVIRFESDLWESEDMYLYLADGFEGELAECDEGDLQWVSRSFVDSLPTWEGDKLFLQKMWRGDPFFHMHLRYQGDCLVYASVDGEILVNKT